MGSDHSEPSTLTAAAGGLSVCLPAYNEAGNLPRLIDTLVRQAAAVIEPFEIVVVDDGSSDNTAEVLAELIHRHPCLRVERHPENRGYGAACLTALRAGRHRLLLSMDSDGQFDLEALPAFLSAADWADMVIGRRAPRSDRLARVLLGKTWSLLIRLLFGVAASDVNCAFKLIHRQAFAAIEPRIQAAGATFSAEWLVRARSAGLLIRELPVRHHPRLAGQPTGARGAVVGRALGELLALRWRLWRDDR